MKKFLRNFLIFSLPIAAVGLYSCGDDEPDGGSFDDDVNDAYVIASGPDQSIGENMLRVNNVIYEINDDGTCSLIGGRDVWYNDNVGYKYFQSTYPTPEFNIPEKVTFDGTTYSVTGVDFRGSNYEGGNSWDIEYLTVPSSVLSFNGADVKPISLTIGANVREVSEVSAVKLFWMPNTPPSGYRSVTADVQFASSDVYPTLIYPHLSSMFTVDGIAYIMTNPAERTCDMVGAVAPVPGSVTCRDEISKDGIEFSVNKIVQYAFAGCKEVNSVSIENIGIIENSAFSGCSNVKSLSLAGISSIGSESFAETAIGKLTIPSSTITIYDGAFRGCGNLTELIVEDGEYTLNLMRPRYYNKFNIFEDTKIQKLYIGRDLTYDDYGDNSPFDHMENLQEVEIRSGETELSNGMFYGCLALESVIIGDDIERIGSKTFSGCSAMKSFKFGKALREIGADAFSDCTALTSFTSEALTPPVCGEQALDDINKWECVLHVPDESIGLYKEAPQWKNFLKIE